MKIKTQIVVTTIVLGLLAVAVTTTYAGGITPVPKLLWVTEDSKLIATNEQGSRDTLFQDTGRLLGPFRDLAIDYTSFPPSPRLVGSTVYISERGVCGGTAGRIVRVDITGGPVNPLTEVIAGLNCPSGVAFDHDTKLLYWSDREEGKIYCTNPVVPAPVRIQVLSGLVFPEGVRVCSDAEKSCGRPGHIFWTELETISEASVAGLNVCTPLVIGDVVVIGLGEPVGLSIGSEKIFWTDKGSGKIARADIDGIGQIGEDIADAVDSVGIGLEFLGNPGNPPDRMFWTIPNDTTRGTNPKIKMRVPGGMVGDPDQDVAIPGGPGPVAGIRVIPPPGQRQIPATSTWGVVVMLLLLLAGGTIAIRQLRASTS